MELLFSIDGARDTGRVPVRLPGPWKGAVGGLFPKAGAATPMTVLSTLTNSRIFGSSDNDVVSGFAFAEVGEDSCEVLSRFAVVALILPRNPLIPSLALIAREGRWRGVVGGGGGAKGRCWNHCHLKEEPRKDYLLFEGQSSAGEKLHGTRETSEEKREDNRPRPLSLRPGCFKISYATDKSLLALSSFCTERKEGNEQTLVILSALGFQVLWG